MGFIGEQRGDKKVCDGLLTGISGLSIFLGAIQFPGEGI